MTAWKYHDSISECKVNDDLGRCFFFFFRREKENVLAELMTTA